MIQIKLYTNTIFLFLDHKKMTAPKFGMWCVSALKVLRGQNYIKTYSRVDNVDEILERVVLVYLITAIEMQFNLNNRKKMQNSDKIYI